MDSLSHIVNNHFEKYKYKTYICSFDLFKIIIFELTYSILHTDSKFIDIVKNLYIKYNVNFNNWNQIIRDTCQYLGEIISKYLNLNENKIKEKFSDDYNGVKERMYFRIELYKFGWNILQIEKYINKYLLKSKETLELQNNNYEFLQTIYFNIFINLNYEKNININSTKKNKVGRPVLPEELKQYLKKKHLKKVKESMVQTYEYYKEYKMIKNNLLSNEEFNLLSSFIPNEEILLNKLKNLKIK